MQAKLKKRNTLQKKQQQYHVIKNLFNMAREHNKIDIFAIEPLAYKYNGNISVIAKKLNVHRHTIYNYFKKDPKGKELIDKVRGINTEYQLDLAEMVINYNMKNYKDNPGLAQRAAEKVIDKKGHLRAWQSTQNDGPQQATLRVNYQNDTNNTVEIPSETLSTSDH